MTLLLLAAVCGLAYWNGANDNSKGVASLLGSGTLGYRRAIQWGTATTFAGSMTAVFLAEELLRRFSGKGLVPDSLAGTDAYVFAVAFGAGATIVIATLTGLPISTTHALTGAMAGAGWMAAGDAVNLAALGTMFLLPLLLSPFLAVGLGAALYLAAHGLRVSAGVTKEGCVCVGAERSAWSVVPEGAAALSATALPTISVADGRVCDERYAGRFLHVPLQRLVDGAHILSAGLVGFARGLNDAPKLAALLLVMPLVERGFMLAIVAIAMALGGLLHARRVALTMSHGITAMTHGQGFAANLATGVLVVAASVAALPVSTTHVAVGSLVGIGMTSGGMNLGVVRTVMLSWVATLPCGVALGAVGYLFVR